MSNALRPIRFHTEAEWVSTSIGLLTRQIGYNTTTGEFRIGPGKWHACAPLNARANTEVVAATTGNITRATALNAGDTLDGVTLVAGDLVLVKDQTAPAENGIYVVGASPARATAYDTWAEHVGKLVRVIGGTTNKNTNWRCNVVAGGTLNTTDLTFESEPSGYLNLANGAVIDTLPKRADDYGNLGSCQVIIMDPTTNQLCTIQVDQLAAYFGV